MSDATAPETPSRETTGMAGGAVLPSHPHEGQACARAWVGLRAIYDQIAGALATDLADACGITLNEFDVLTALSPYPPPTGSDPALPTDPVRLYLGDLGAHVALSQPAISRLVARLEERGLLRRSGGAPDRRTVLLELTPTGSELAQRAAAVQAAAVNRLVLARLSPTELDALASLFARLIGSPD